MTAGARYRISRGRTYFLRATFMVLFAVLVCPHALAQFALAVSPPRLELSGKPGQTLRQVIELSQADVRAGSYKLRTADWTLRPDASVEFSDALLPGSCRPWVAIERHEVTVTPGRPYRFRFEITPPADAPATECRFAILIEGKEQAVDPRLPIGLSARIGVIVYLAIGDVQPVLTVVGSAAGSINRQGQPVLTIRNEGNAHGRVAGFLSGTDASGTALEFSPGSTPIMPGETRDIALAASRPGSPDAQVDVKFPVTVRGKLEWGTAGSTTIDQLFSQ